jgi:hypothetical protein
MLPGEGIGGGTSTQVRATVELANKQQLQRAARILTDFVLISLFSLLFAKRLRSAATLVGNSMDGRFFNL